MNPIAPTDRVGTKISCHLNSAKICFALCLSVIAGFFAAPKSAGQAYSLTNYWTGAGADLFWPTAGNWSNSIAPGSSSLIVFTNYGLSGVPGTNGSGAVGTPNIVVTNNTTLGTLWIVNTNLTGGTAVFHTIGISNGATLTVSNSAVSGTNVTNIIQVCSQSGAAGQWNGADNGVAQAIYGTIQGGNGATLSVICTNGATTYQRGNIFITQGSSGLSAPPTIDPLNATLDLSGLDNFNASVNHICIGADVSSGFFFNRACGTFYLAKTNIINLLSVGTEPSGPSTSTGLSIGLLAQNNSGGTNRFGKLFMGYSNAFYCNTGIGVGVRNTSAYMGFNPSNAPGGTALFRNLAGTGRQTMWAVGSRLGITASGQITTGELDFSQGTVDAQVDQLQIGRSASGLLTYGTLSFGAGNIDVNTLQLGYQGASGNAAGQGTLNVSNTAVMKINTSGVMGFISGGLAIGSTYFGKMNILNGGTVQFASVAPLTCGVGSSSEIRVQNGSKLQVSTVGTSTAPLTLLQLANSTLTIDGGVLPNPTAPMINVTTLDTSGTNTINLLGSALVKGTITLIKYSAWTNGGFSNLVFGSSPTVSGFLSNNVGNSSIDFVITNSTVSFLVWDGRTNAVNIGTWDIGAPTNWQGGLAYTQSGAVGNLVQFDDTALGTTSVTINNTNLAPAYVFVTNSTLTYTFGGTGSLTGSGGINKDGTGLMTLGNTGTNTIGGSITVNGGTLQISTANDRLPTNAVVTLANNSGVALDLNNLNQRLGSVTGGGANGGNITLGLGTLTLAGGGGNFAGVISGAGGLNKFGSGTQILSGANLYAGGTVISNSAILVANLSGSGLGSGPVTIGTGGTLQIGDGSVTGAVDATTITNNGVLTLNPASSITLTKFVTGSGSVTKTFGTGATVYITNANAYSGGTTIQQGVVQISDPNALGSGVINVGNSTANPTYLALAGNITVTNAISISAKTGGLVPSPVDINNVNDVNTGLSGTNTLTGNMTFSGSTLWSVGSDAGRLIVAGRFIDNETITPRGLTLRGAASGDWRSAITDGTGGSSVLSVAKYDAGTWTLSGTNTYTGATQIFEGNLVLNGKLLGGGSVMLFPGTTLSGSGVISGAVTNIGVIFPGGDSVLGTLTISNQLFLDSGSGVTFDVSTNGNDMLAGMTNVIYGGTLKVVVAGILTGNCVFKLFNSQSYSGSFEGFDLPDITPLTWDTSHLLVDGTLHAIGGPVVTPVFSSISVNAPGSFSLSGTGTLVAPYSILASTNAGLPLISWVNIGGGTIINGQFQFTDVVGTNYPQRYYRLTTPLP